MTGPNPDDTLGHLHQASFYGPSIPSNSTPSSRSKDFSAYTILCIAFKMMTIILIIIGIAVVTLWLIFQPQSLKARAVAASLTTFDLSGPGDSILGYNLTVRLTFRNPNAKYNMYYERMQAQAIYNRQLLLATAHFPRMHQPRKSTMPVSMRFLGVENVTGDSAVKRNYGREKGEGFFYVSIRVYTTVRLKMVLIESVKFKPYVDCLLRLPVPTNATSLAAGFTATQCDVRNFS
ncbi:hypothetical protein KSP40_PGU016060 [Platanthera guangdongensis]|uniref:Late embryogenesis abundant protein LEA-2 subgroup domain-containing protein n=1 Tax=Platanthera guangdongensis TaxID=2320717 RepID=A0ABR2N4M3_9ASPA